MLRLLEHDSAVQTIKVVLVFSLLQRVISSDVYGLSEVMQASVVLWGVFGGGEQVMLQPLKQTTEHEKPAGPGWQTDHRDPSRCV